MLAGGAAPRGGDRAWSAGTSAWLSKTTRTTPSAVAPSVSVPTGVSTVVAARSVGARPSDGGAPASPRSAALVVGHALGADALCGDRDLLDEEASP